MNDRTHVVVGDDGSLIHSCAPGKHVYEEYSFRCQICGKRQDERDQDPIRSAGQNPIVAQLVTTKSDAERATELRAQLHVAWTPVLALMDEAAKAGFLVRWAAVQPNLFGKHELIDLHLVKRF